MQLSRALLILLPLGSTAAWADVIVNNSVSLSNLQVTVGSSNLPILPGTAAVAFAQAFNSHQAQVLETDCVTGIGPGGFPADCNDGPVFVSAALPYASADATSDAITMTAKAHSNLNIPNQLNDSLGSSSQTTLETFFDITGISGPVLTDIGVTLSLDQFLLTNGTGQSATSRVDLSIIVRDMNGNELFPLFFNNPLSIGPNQTLHFTDILTLSSPVTLMSDTAYDLILVQDSLSSGVSTPEPASFILFSTAAGLLAVIAGVSRRRPLPAPRPEP